MPGAEGPLRTFIASHALAAEPPKHLTGPDLGIPSLTRPRAWYAAGTARRPGRALGKILRGTTWADYLGFRRRAQ